MAASTRFHGSVWLPGAKGMFPSGSWTDAIASTVCATSARVITPSTCGSWCSGKASLSPLGHSRCNLLAVEHHALAEHRVQRPLGDTRPTRVVLDQHAQEVVVAAYRCRLRVLQTERA